MLKYNVILLALVFLLLSSLATATSVFHRVQQEANMNDEKSRNDFVDDFPGPRPSTVNTTVRWETQNLDHFGWRNDTYQQRWFVYDKFYIAGGPVLFVTGNEVSAALLVNWTATAWRLGLKYNGLIVVAEHRFYGESQPCPGGVDQCGDYLSMEQALQDYINLIFKIRTVYYPGVGAVIAIGGSYGGILAASIRLKYPSIVQGSIASSGPIGNMNTTFKPSSYWQVISNTMETMTPGCKTATYKALSVATAMLQKGGSTAQMVQNIFGFCTVPTLTDFSVWTRAQFDAAAMGNYPFSTDYILGDLTHPSPPLPVKVMCEKIVPQAATDIGMLEQVAAAMAVVANVTQDQKCFDVQNIGKSVTSNRWDLQVCTEFLMNELPFYGCDGLPNDAFPPAASYTRADYNAYCLKGHNKMPRFDHMRNHGFTADAYTKASNIIATATLYGPWSAGNLGRSSEGYFYNISDTVITYTCPDCGHHQDLMWAAPAEGPSVGWIRMRQEQFVQTWINQYNDEMKNRKKNGDL